MSKPDKGEWAQSDGREALLHPFQKGRNIYWEKVENSTICKNNEKLVGF